jgi:hypothetical protein
MHSREIRCSSTHPRKPKLASLLQIRHAKCFLGREVLIKTGFDDLSLGNNLVNARGVVALLVKELLCRIENAIAWGKWLVSFIHNVTLVQTDWSVKVNSSGDFCITPLIL